MQNDEQAVTPELQRLQLVMQALSAQRTQAEDSLALASAEITMLTTALKTAQAQHDEAKALAKTAQAQHDEAKALAKTTLETAHALCRAYDNAIVGNADGCPDGGAEVAELRAKLGYQD